MTDFSKEAGCDDGVVAEDEGCEEERCLEDVENLSKKTELVFVSGTGTLEKGPVGGRLARDGSSSLLSFYPLLTHRTCVGCERATDLHMLAVVPAVKASRARLSGRRMNAWRRRAELGGTMNSWTYGFDGRQKRNDSFNQKRETTKKREKFYTTVRLACLKSPDFLSPPDPWLALFSFNSTQMSSKRLFNCTTLSSLSSILRISVSTLSIKLFDEPID